MLGNSAGEIAVTAVRLDRTTTAAVARPPGEALLEEELSLHARVVQRDESALLQCFDRIGHLVYCTALLCTGSRTSAEELTEAMFVRFWRDPRAFPPSGGPLSLQLIRRMTADVALSARR